MMSHLDRGFVVPVWVRNLLSGPTSWSEAWAKANFRQWVIVPHSPASRYGNDEFRPRDPNRADDPPGDRPDLLEATQ